ncbi:MAG: ATP synthase F1 subunit epsilon [Bacteroidaceae bacterium]|nr:ATP synthase F1 subunit epsilon [Bacteroidaceae bacterium]
MLKVSVYSPVRNLYEGSAKSVELPSEKGRFMVLENHAPVLALLETGTVYIMTDNDTLVEFAISGGFAKVCNNVIDVCVETVQ